MAGGYGDLPPGTTPLQVSQSDSARDPCGVVVGAKELSVARVCTQWTCAAQCAGAARTHRCSVCTLVVAHRVCYTVQIPAPKGSVLFIDSALWHR